MIETLPSNESDMIRKGTNVPWWTYYSGIWLKRTKIFMNILVRTYRFGIKIWTQHHEDKNTHSNAMFGCFVRFEVITAVLLKIQVFRNWTRNIPAEWSLRFLHLHFLHLRTCPVPYKVASSGYEVVKTTCIKKSFRLSKPANRRWPSKLCLHSQPL